MCGIIGTFKKVLDFDLKNLQHRGPDASGKKEFGLYSVGHTRLAIIDTSHAADQPFEYNGTVLCFNGEIYNFQELAQEYLNDEVYVSDTVVLSHLLYKYDLEWVLERLDGMFAFFYYDGSNGYLVRDRFGKIPLFWNNYNGIAWSSEQKGFNKFMIEFPAGSYYCFETSSIVKYYNPVTKLYRPFTLDVLVNAVRKRMIADVPLCCLISGGLDSSLILAIAKTINPNIVAYTAVFDKNSEDRKFAKEICDLLNVELREVFIDPPGMISVGHTIRTIEMSMKAQVEISLLNLPLAEQIKNDGFKVCLSGEGADEVFGGYGNFCIAANKADREEWRALKIEQVAKMSRGNFQRANLVFMAHSIECRLPFIDRDIVEFGINATKEENPAGKKILKKEAKKILPDRIINRKKDTFQGGAGMAQYMEEYLQGAQIKTYNGIYNELFSLKQTSLF